MPDKTQQKGIRNTVIFCLIAVALVLGIFVQRIVRDNQVVDIQDLSSLIILPKPSEVINVSLLDQNGYEFNVPENLLGKWSVMFFGFTHCSSICPATMSAFMQTMGELNKYGIESDNVAFYLVSVDPQRDTPQVIKDYLSWTDGKIMGVTGEHSKIAEFASQVSIAFAKMPAVNIMHGQHAMHGADSDDANAYVIEHSTQIIIFNPMGHFHGFLKAPHNPKVIAASIYTLKKSLN